MKKFALIVAALALSVGSAMAQLSFVGNGYVVLSVNGGGNTFYFLDNDDFFNGAFDSDNSSANAFSRTITINQGESILLGGENQTFDQGGGTSSYLGYRVSTDFSSGIFAELGLPYLDSPGSNDRWQQQAGASMVEIGSVLAVGTYYLEIYQHANRDATDVYNNEAGSGGNNYELRIEVVPEPSTIMLGAVGLVGLFVARRRMAK